MKALANLAVTNPSKDHIPPPTTVATVPLGGISEIGDKLR